MRLPETIVTITSLFTLIHLDQTEKLIQNTTGNTGNTLWALLERELAPFCHLKQFKNNRHSRRQKRQLMIAAILMTWLISSTPLLHLLKPSIESILFPNHYTSKRNKKLFTTIQKLEKQNDRINRIQTKQIQKNADNFETQLAVTELMSLVHSYTSSGKNGIPAAIYET